jgi:outer membrane protein TolC
LVQQVLARNPTVAQMTAAWQAAAARYPQVTSLEDPMTETTIGPDTFAPDDPATEFAYRIMISQKLPFPGKLGLKGENALAEARAAGHEVEDTRLQLAEAGRQAFADYYLADRLLEVNAEGLKLLDEIHRDALARYRSPDPKMKTNQQDVLQVEVEIGRQREMRLTLERTRRVTVARINTLLHLPPDAPLPPPPAKISPDEGLPDAAALRAVALARRPDLLALADRIAAEEARLALAHKEYCPDFEPFVMYDRFMGNNDSNRDLATMVGVRMNLPVYRARRDAAVDEATARIAQRRAELERQIDQVNYEVQQAYEMVAESQRVLRLYSETILKAARANIAAARPAYQTGLIGVLNLIEAQRDRINLEERFHQAVGDYLRRRATLERAVGGPLDENMAARGAH